MAGKKATLDISGYRITIDREDFDRVAAHKWHPYFINGSRLSFYSDSARQLLGGFIMQVLPTVFVEQVGASKPFDYRKRNLRVYKAPAPKGHTL